MSAFALVAFGAVVVLAAAATLSDPLGLLVFPLLLLIAVVLAISVYAVKKAGDWD